MLEMFPLPYFIYNSQLLHNIPVEQIDIPSLVELDICGDELRRKYMNKVVGQLERLEFPTQRFPIINNPDYRNGLEIIKLKRKWRQSYIDPYALINDNFHPDNAARLMFLFFRKKIYQIGLKDPSTLHGNLSFLTKLVDKHLKNGKIDLMEFSNIRSSLLIDEQYVADAYFCLYMSKNEFSAARRLPNGMVPCDGRTITKEEYLELFKQTQSSSENLKIPPTVKEENQMSSIVKHATKLIKDDLSVYLIKPVVPTTGNTDLDNEINQLIECAKDSSTALVGNLRKFRSEMMETEVKIKDKLKDIETAILYGKETGNYIPLQVLTKGLSSLGDSNVPEELLKIPFDWKPLKKPSPSRKK